MTARDVRLTVRLSEAEAAALEDLARQFDLDKSATVRRLIAQVTPLNNAGFFTPFDSDAAIHVRLKEDHE